MILCVDVINIILYQHYFIIIIYIQFLGIQFNFYCKINVEKYKLY